jgi:hypothetical protein
MELKTSEENGAVRWLLGAGAAAIGLSLVLFWADDSVMGNAKERDVAHNAQLRQLRVAQSGLPSGVTDERQTLPLEIEAEAQGVTTKK